MAERPDEQHEIDSNAAKLAVMGHVSVVIDVLLIGGCLYLLASDFTKAVTGAPEFVTRGGSFLVNVSATFALLHRSTALLKRFRSAPSAQQSVGVNKWAIAWLLALPLLVASLAEVLVHGAHRGQLEALVTDISTRTVDAIATHKLVRAADLVSLQGPYLEKLTVRTDNGTFLLDARVPSLGTDGYSARYSSLEKIWYLDPYGVPPATSPVFDALGPTLVCELADRRLDCERRGP